MRWLVRGFVIGFALIGMCFAGLLAYGVHVRYAVEEAELRRHAASTEHPRYRCELLAAAECLPWVSAECLESEQARCCGSDGCDEHWEIDESRLIETLQRIEADRASRASAGVAVTDEGR